MTESSEKKAASPQEARLEKVPYADSTVKTVTLYEDRGEVLRTFDVSVPQGVSKIVLAGITPFIDDRSLWVKCASPRVRVVSAKVFRKIEWDVDSQKTGSLEERCRALVCETVDEHRRCILASQECTRLKSLFKTLTRSVEEVPPASVSGQWIQSLEETGMALDSALERRVRSGRRVRQLAAKACRAIAELRASRRADPKFHSLVEVQVETQAPAADDGSGSTNSPAVCSFEMGYRTPCALWRPEYLARLVEAEAAGTEAGANTAAGKGMMELFRRASVWQMTGEEWNGVQLILSTARPAQHAKAPLLEDDRITLRKKTQEEIKKISAVVREQKVGSLGNGGAASELPGVDDGGETRNFEVPGLSSIPSDGLPHHVDLGMHSLEAEVSLTAFPEISQGVHLKAAARLPASAMPLLAGPVQLARTVGYVGRTSISYIAPGDEIVLGFGTDDALRIHRSVYQKETEATLTSRKSIQRNVTINVSNFSDSEKRFIVEERVPVSEIEGVDVSVEQKNGFSGPDKDGFLKADLAVPPNQTSVLKIAYCVTAADKVNLSL